MRRLAVIRRAIFASAAYLVACGVFSLAQGAESSGPAVYNPHTKSYFRLYHDNIRPGNWEGAVTRARSKIYKGVAGRLAHVEDMETHKFLIANLGLKKEKEPIWIGLRYWCQLRMLQWTSDRAFSPSDPERFRMWHTNWSVQVKGGSACGMDASKGRSGYAPVFYRTRNSVTRWQATGAGKGFKNYVVEFVTGGE